MSTTTAGASHGTTRNNGATVLKGGDIDTSATVTNAPYEGIVSFRSGKHGGEPNESSSHNQKAVSAGTWATMVAGSYVTRKIAETLAGVANTVLLFGNSDYGRRSIHYKTNRRSYQITDWSYITGAREGVTTSNDAFGDDHAATPTRAVPGELVYFDHAPAASGSLAVPLYDDYEEKTG
jgi:hypothetical protein